MTERLTRRGMLRVAGLGGVGGAALITAGATAAGAQTAGTTFFPVAPYRSYDSRDDRVVLRTNEEFDLDLVTDANGVLQIPQDAKAVTYNLTIADTVGAGFLGIFPANVEWPGNSSINWWQSGLLLANGGTVALGLSPVTNLVGSVALHAGGPGSTAFLVDVTGYFR
jgi:hypothetical protein